VRGVFFRKKKVGPEYYYERGEECLQNGNYQWAIESFTKAIEFNPGLEMAYYRRAEAYRKLGKIREVISDCIRFLETDRRQPDMAEDFDDALKEAFKIARRGWEQDRAKEEIISFGIPALLDELIEEYDPRREYADKRFYQLSLSWLGESPARDARRIGFVQLLRGKFDEAIEELNRSVEESPEDPDTYYFKGVALLGKRKTEESKRGIFKRGERAEELSQRARENFEQAIKRNQSLRLCPDCGYRTSSRTNFCIHCGSRLLSGNRVQNNV
jgi:tetratricopeptide (TPR) repeat protein